MAWWQRSPPHCSRLPSSPVGGQANPRKIAWEGGLSTLTLYTTVPKWIRPLWARELSSQKGKASHVRFRVPEDCGNVVMPSENWLVIIMTFRSLVTDGENYYFPHYVICLLCNLVHQHKSLKQLLKKDLQCSKQNEGHNSMQILMWYYLHLVMAAIRAPFPHPQNTFYYKILPIKNALCISISVRFQPFANLCIKSKITMRVQYILKLKCTCHLVLLLSSALVVSKMKVLFPFWHPSWSRIFFWRIHMPSSLSHPHSRVSPAFTRLFLKLGMIYIFLKAQSTFAWCMDGKVHIFDGPAHATAFSSPQDPWPPPPSGLPFPVWEIPGDLQVVPGEDRVWRGEGSSAGLWCHRVHPPKFLQRNYSLQINVIPGELQVPVVDWHPHFYWLTFGGLLKKISATDRSLEKAR